MMRAVKIAGEHLDSDWVNTPSEHEDPSYPYCELCETESDNAEGFCTGCNQYVHEHNLKPFSEWVEPLSELRRNGTTGGSYWL
jgi:hypothetical protein